jgi:hypothetical protein
MKEKLKSILHGRAHFSKSSRITSGTLSKGGEAASSASNRKKQAGDVGLKILVSPVQIWFLYEIGYTGCRK